MAASRTLIRSLVEGLSTIADPDRAPQMQAYMRSTMPFRGITAKDRRTAIRSVLNGFEFKSEGQWRDTVLQMWRRAEFREDRYAVLDLLDHKISRPFQHPPALEIYEELIVTGAWWDLVDALASHQVGGLLIKHPQVITPVMRAWSEDPDLWKRRTAIICQLKRKADVDLALLYDAIAPSLEDSPYLRSIGTPDGPPSDLSEADQRFFLRKGIGWAAHRDPEEIIRYVHKNAGRLSGLSMREALKHHRAHLPAS